MLTAITKTQTSVWYFILAGGLSCFSCLSTAGEMNLKQLLADRQVDEKLMEAARGGMEINGLNVDIGLQRTVMINGAVQSVSQLQWNSNNQAAAFSNLNPIVISNTINGQMVQVQTAINANVTNLAMYRQLLSNQAITQALIRGLH
ncbi:hypothetical protein QU481_14995 [Crenobacter sp. SG2303]|uniref:Uncharacterized protein n=1 Tax=Crenobacter oryzisoli TaxID=3056844 RepID=A0ABT7XQW6_9NEIS|nr:hypothetical protein [Crenobacter sp. SG2303]MDN0076191.1 hypothetical protein [Crenobacter sp. SG2303]